MISKQSKDHKKRSAPNVKPQVEVDKDFDETVDHEANLHTPQVNDFQTMEPLSGNPPETLSVSTKKEYSANQVTVDDIFYVLSRHPEIDRSDILIRMNNGEVILTGSVPEERMKFMAGEVIKLVRGVKSVSNQLKHSKVP